MKSKEGSLGSFIGRSRSLLYRAGYRTGYLLGYNENMAHLSENSTKSSAKDPVADPDSERSSRHSDTPASMRWVWLGLGWFFFALGIIGAFLPIVPTTPFMLLAAACFSRGSQRLHQWLLDQPTFGPSLRDWEDYGVIRKKGKVLSIATIVVFFSATLIFVNVPLGVKAVVALTGLGVITFIGSRPSEPPPSQSTSDRAR